MEKIIEARIVDDKEIEILIDSIYLNASDTRLKVDKETYEKISQEAKDLVDDF